MTDGFDLGKYLQDARAEGQQDSEGSFTIAQDKALSKLAHFALPGEFDWVLKIVQAANLWSCPNLQVRQTRIATSFYFRPPAAKFPSDSEIVGALSRGSAEADGPVHELCIALRALVDQAKLSFVLATRYEGEMGSPIYSGDDVSALGGWERQRWSTLTRDGLRLTVSHFKGNESFTGRYIPTFSRVARRNVAIAEILRTRAFCSPVAIFLDGLEITNPFHHRKIGQNLFYRPLALGLGDSVGTTLEFQSYPALTASRQLQRPTQLKDPDLPWCLLRTFEWLALEEYRVTSQKLLGTFNLEYLESEQHRVFWVRHGVICHNQTIFNGSIATAALLFLPANQLRSDLTGLAVHMDEEATERANRFQQLVGDSLEQITSRLPVLTAKVGANSQLAVQQTTEHDDIEKLEAGFSIFTAGLTTGVSSIESLSKDLHRVWRRLRGLPFQKSLLKRWGQFVEKELKRIKVDLANERRDAMREF
jgi:hypothetical protein